MNLPIVWTKENIRKILSEPLGQTEQMNHRTFVKKAAIALWNRQTQDEKQAEATFHTNGVGFNGPDGQALAWFCQATIAGVKFSDRIIVKNAKRLLKYSGQLEQIALMSVQSQAKQ